MRDKKRYLHKKTSQSTLMICGQGYKYELTNLSLNKLGPSLSLNVEPKIQILKV